MIWKVAQNTIIFLTVISLFILILMLPKEREKEALGGKRFVAEYPFTFELCKENISTFINHFQEEKGFGTTTAGMPLTEYMQWFLIRSLKIIASAFVLAMIFGTALGILLFYFRKKRRRNYSFFRCLLLFLIFLFITLQYI